MTAAHAGMTGGFGNQWKAPHLSSLRNDMRPRINLLYIGEKFADFIDWACYRIDCLVERVAEWCKSLNPPR